MEVFESLKANLVGKNARIVLPEGEEPRILQATKTPGKRNRSNSCFAWKS